MSGAEKDIELFIYTLMKVNELREQVKCPKCFKLLSKPVVSNCSHIYCSACFDYIVSSTVPGNKVICPMCKVVMNKRKKRPHQSSESTVNFIRSIEEKLQKEFKIYENLLSQLVVDYTELLEDRQKNIISAPFDVVANNKPALKTYKNNAKQNKKVQEEIADAQHVFQNTQSRDDIIKWLSDNKNEFDRLTQTTMNADSSDDFEECNMSSISQVNKQKKVKIDAKNTLMRRCKSFNEQEMVKKTKSVLKRKSTGNADVRSKDKAKLMLIMQKMEDECLDNLNKEFSSGWKRLKTLNKSSKKGSPPLKKLKVQKLQLKVTPPEKVSLNKSPEASVSRNVKIKPNLSRTETVVREDTVIENEASADDTIETVVEKNNSNLNIEQNSITKRVPYVHLANMESFFQKQIPQLIGDNMTQSEYSVFEPNDRREAVLTNRSNQIFQSKEMELVVENTSADDNDLFSMPTQKVNEVQDLNTSYEDMFKKIERKIAKDMSGAKASAIKSLINTIQPLMLQLDAVVQDKDYYNIKNLLITDVSTQTDFNHEQPTVQTESYAVQTESPSVISISTQTNKAKCEVCTARQNTHLNEKCVQTSNKEVKSVFVQTNENVPTPTLSENLDDFNFTTQQFLEAKVSKPQSSEIKILQNVALSPPKKKRENRHQVVDNQESITQIMENFDITALELNKENEKIEGTQETISQIMSNLNEQSDVLQSDVIVIDDTAPEPQPSTSKNVQILSDNDSEEDTILIRNAQSSDRLVHSTPLNAVKRKMINIALSAIKANDDPLLNALIETSLENKSGNDLLLTAETQPKKRNRKLSFAEENSNKNFKRIRTASPDLESQRENTFKWNNKRFMQEQLMVQFDTQSQARSPLTKIELPSSDSDLNMDLVEEVWKKVDKGLIGKSPKKSQTKMLTPKKKVKVSKKSDNIQDLLNKCDLLVNSVSKKLNKPPSVVDFDDKENDIEEAMANFKSAESVSNKNATVVSGSDDELFQSDTEDVIEGTPTKCNVQRIDRTITPPREFQDSADITLVPSTPPKRKTVDSPIIVSQTDAFSPITNLVSMKTLQMSRCMSRSFIEKKCSTPKTQSNQLSLKSFMKKNKQEEKVIFEQQKPNVACTRLVKDQIINIMTLAQKNLITYSSGFSDKVTHMIVNTNNENQVKDDTIKYVNAVASGAWVLNYQWIKDCLKQNRIIPELCYEVLDSSGLPGPKDSRLYRKLKPLFRGFKIHAAPPFISTTRGDLENVITKLGGKVAKCVDEFLDKDGDICLIVTESGNTQQFNLYGDWLETLKVITVDLEWLSRSVGQYKLVSVRKYALCPDEAICDLGYPEDLMIADVTQQSFM